MRLFIRVKDGQPLGNPIFEDNFKAAFPDVDIDNLPPEFANFNRIPPPQVNIFEVAEPQPYAWDGAAYTDVYAVRPMTAEEKTAAFAVLELSKPGPNWTFNETTNLWEMPPRPTTPGPWRYDRVLNDWVIVNTPPKKGWIVSPDGTHYIPPFPRPEPTEGVTAYVWDEEIENWKPITATQIQITNE